MSRKTTRIVTESSTTSLVMMKHSLDEFRIGWCAKCSADVIWVARKAMRSTAYSGHLPGHSTDGFVCLRSVMEGADSI